jgi:hypothetical protein
MPYYEQYILCSRNQMPSGIPKFMEKKTMNDILLNLFVLAVFAIIAVGILLFVRNKQAEQGREIERMAAEHGWTCESFREPLSWGTRIKGTNWTLEAVSTSSGRETGPGSSDVSMSTTWKADAPGSTLLIGKGSAQANLGAMGEALTQQVLKMALGADAEGVVEVEVGGPEFRSQYMVWAQEPAEAARLVSPALQAALMKWKGEPPVIKRTSQGLVIEVRGAHLKNPAELTALIQIGELLLAEY